MKSAIKSALSLGRALRVQHASSPRVATRGLYEATRVPLSLQGSIVTLVLFALLWSAVPAAEPPKAAPPPAKEKPSPQTATLKPESVIPKRELVFDESAEEVGLEFPSPETLGPRVAEVAQQRYLVSLSLQFRLARRRGDPSDLTPLDERLERDWSGLWNTRTPRLFEFLDKLPRDRFPSDETWTMLTSGQEVHVFRVSFSGIRPEQEDLDGPRLGKPPRIPGRSPRPPDVQVERQTMHVALLAPTAERAKELAKGVLLACDYGYSFPLYRDFVELRAYWDSELAKMRAESKTMGDEMSARQERLEGLKEWSDITKESLVNFVSQQRLIAVEEAGIKARIAACEKLLKGLRAAGGAPGPSQRAEQVESVKTAAEIELAGLAAKRDAVQQLIDKGLERSKLESEIAQFRKEIDRRSRLLSIVEARVAACKLAIDEKLPFAQVDGKILIRRVRWGQPASPAAGEFRRRSSPATGKGRN